MESRIMNRLGIDMPLLGMGLMRLPLNDDGSIDEPQSLEMVDTMYRAGVRYFDTAYIYIGGESERFVKKSLVDRYPRDSFCVASKLPLDYVKSPDDNSRIFNESISRMGVDYIDFYLLHGINYEAWRHAVDMKSDVFQRSLKEKGLVRHIGFSFHGSPEDLEKILSEQPDWDFIQLQINYYDWYTDTAKRLYEIVSGRGIPVIVMEPVRGGALANVGDDVHGLFAANRPGQTDVSWAMRWIGSLPGVNVVLSGISTLDMAKENVGYYSPLEPVTEDDIKVIEKAVNIIQSRPFIPCTGCKYCSECPQEIDIASIFRASNAYTRLHDKGGALWRYFQFVPEEHRATACIGCRLCVDRCPQSIDIPAELAKCHELLTSLRG